MSWLAVVNPASGGGKSGAQLEKLIQELEPVTQDVLVTGHCGHATEVVSRAAGYSGVLAVGGDGTVFECINGLDLERQRLAVIPSGTGNSLAQHLGIQDIRAGVEACKRGLESAIDLIHVEYRTGIGQIRTAMAGATIGLGYPANLVALGNRRLKGLKRLCYPVAGVIQSFRQNHLGLSITVNGGGTEPKDLKGVLINNTEYAGNFRVFPNAKLRDGRFEVMEMTVGPFRQNLQNFLLLIQSYVYMPGRRFRSDALTMELKQRNVLMVDGETIEEVEEVRFEIRPRILKCMTPGLPE